MGQDLNNISPSNIFQNMLLSERYHKNSQAVLAVVSINGLRQLAYMVSQF